jgi:predicted nucleic acid-binding protein
MVTTAGRRLFVDTNILMYSVLTASPFHAAADESLNALDTAGAELWTSRQILREFVAAMTRPGVASPMPPVASVLADVRRFATQFRIAEDGPLVTDELLRLIAAIPCGGKQVHDANIVATMLAHRIPTLLTHNVPDFQRFTTLITIQPLVP